MVAREEWGQLIIAQTALRTSTLLGRCEVQPSHGWAQYLLQTPDHRAIALCTACYGEVVEEQELGKAKAQRA